MPPRTFKTPEKPKPKPTVSPIPNPLAQALIAITALVSSLVPPVAPLLVLVAAVYQRWALLLLPLSVSFVWYINQYRMVIIAASAFALILLSFMQRAEALREGIKNMKPSGQQANNPMAPPQKTPAWQPFFKVVVANPYVVIIPAVFGVGAYEGNTGTLVVSALALLAELKGWTVRQGVLLFVSFVVSVFPPAGVLLGVSKFSQWDGETLIALMKPLAAVSVAARDMAKKLGIRLPPRIVFEGDIKALSVTGLLEIIKAAAEKAAERAGTEEEEVRIEIIHSPPDIVIQAGEGVGGTILDTLRRLSDALEKIPVRNEDPRAQFRPPFVVGRDGVTPFTKLIPDYRHEHTRKAVGDMPLFPRRTIGAKFEASVPVGISDHSVLPPWKVIKEGKKYNIQIIPRSRLAFFRVTPRSALHTLIAAASGGGKSVVVYAVTNLGTWGVLEHILDESAPPLPVVSYTVIDGKGDAIKSLPDADIYLARQKIIGGIDPVPLTFWYMAEAQAANYRMQVPTRFLDELKGELGEWLNRAFPLSEWWDKVILVPELVNRVNDWRELPGAFVGQNPPSYEIALAFSLVPFHFLITDEFLDLTTNMRTIRKYELSVRIDGEEKKIEINPGASLMSTLQSILVIVRSAGVGVIVTTQKTKKEEYTIAGRNVRDAFGIVVSNLKPNEWTSLGLSPRQFTGDRNVTIPTYSWAANTPLVGVGDADGDKQARVDTSVFYLPEVTPGRMAFPPEVVYNWFNWFMQQTPRQLEADGRPPFPAKFVRDVPIGLQLFLGEHLHTPLGGIWKELYEDIPLLLLKMWGCVPYRAVRLKSEGEYRAEWEQYRKAVRERIAPLVHNGRGSPAKITQELDKIPPPTVVAEEGDERQFMSLARPYAIDKKEEMTI